MRRRHAVPRLKGKQVALSLYLKPRQYWLLKAVSDRSGLSMQYLLRKALEHVLTDAFRHGLVSADAHKTQSTG